MNSNAQKIAVIIEKIILIAFAVFSLLNFLSFLTKYENRYDFAVFLSSMPVWILFIISASAVFLLFLLLFRKMVSRIVERKILSYGVIIIAVVLPRLLAIGIFRVTPLSDFKLYHDIASGLAKGEIIASGYISLFPHTFGYPAVLSLLYRIFGPHYLAGQLLNVLAGVGIAVLIYQTGSILFSREAGFSAALFWAVWPSQVLYCTLICTETLFTFLMLLNIRVFISIIRKEPLRKAAFAGLGLLCAYTNCIRPFGIILTASFILVLILDGLKHKGTLATKAVSCLILAAAYLVSASLFGMGLSGIIGRKTAGFPAGFNLLTGSNIKYAGTWNIEDSRILSDYTDNGSFDAQEVQNAVMDIAIRRYEAQGLENFRLFCMKYKVLWASDDDIINYMRAGLEENPEDSVLFSSIARYLRLICNVYYLMMTCLCIVSAIRLYRHEPGVPAYAFILFILGTAAAHLLLEVAGRYHYPTVSLLSMLAGAGSEAALDHLKHSRIKAGMKPSPQKP